MQQTSFVPMSDKTSRYLLLGRLGFAGLWLLQPLWILLLAPPQLGNRYVLLALLWLPLWLPFYGIVKGHAYTLAWANFIVMIYFLHSLTNMWVSTGLHQFLSFVEFALATMMFIGCTYYARYRGQELGLKIPKLKDDPRR
ncbi:DUF2069 domain-containing protein [Rheinheimera baltica]|uniref:DUF2069 domain-containing protein n=1 Tax=Rheinheimera baltica TaxID=67576 RepID=A0ABT9HYW4_9GAMM|nr:DUF2069 domain-containing protein [Rheinheimera baltica]MDP5136315.1 DUF2069 domain-containing protein [Rheinheimera baltica]MDP5144659.1 DUF2069 domain-containing protein [Rheinheimera baltica]MDP5151372.1 DUF2069 domain-containing protein [Rheinheimera baltica]MDP5190202.1 DUF2069 domain-containing protein [Rheinheimera baltica]